MIGSISAGGAWAHILNSGWLSSLMPWPPVNENFFYIYKWFQIKSIIYKKKWNSDSNVTYSNRANARFLCSCFPQQYGNWSFGTFVFTVCVIVSNLKVSNDSRDCSKNLICLRERLNFTVSKFDIRSYIRSSKLWIPGVEFFSIKWTVSRQFGWSCLSFPHNSLWNLTLAKN